MKNFNLIVLAIVATMMITLTASAESCRDRDLRLHTGGTTMDIDSTSGITAYNFTGYENGMKFNGVGITSGANGTLKTTGYKKGCKVDSVASGSSVSKAKSRGYIGTVTASGDMTQTGLSIQGAGVVGCYSTSSVVKVNGRTTLR